MPRLIDQLGFVGDPFASYVAENEPDIDQYFVRPRYYSMLKGRALSPSSFVLFGARGAGKSAARLAVHKDLWTRIVKMDKSPLVLTLDSFSFILKDGLEKADLKGFISEIGFALIETLLIWLAALPDDDRDVYTKTLNRDEEELVVGLTTRFYLQRPEAARAISSRKTMQLLDQAWTDRTVLWVQQRRNQIAALVATLAGNFAKKRLDIDGSLDSNLEQLLFRANIDFNEAHFANAVLTRFVDCARAFGFSGIVVLVDKVDETHETSNSSDASAKLLFPVLSTVQLLEIDGLGWAFFLWDRLKEPYGAGPHPVRLDKIANATIGWKEEFLAELVDNRIRHFSRGKVAGFSEMCDAPESSRTWLGEVIAVSMQSPRELIRALDTILREHDNRFADSAPNPKIDREAIETGLDAYAVEQAENTFRTPVLRQLFRMNKTSFINKEVQSLFRINTASARNRIRSWVDAGLVARTGERPAEGGVGGKPSHEFSIADPRVRRIVERGLASRMQIPAKAEEETAGAGGDEEE